MTTQEHLAKPGWWPTRLATPRDNYVGSEACSPCHAGIAKTQPTSEMALSLTPARDSAYLISHYGKPFVVDGFSYNVTDLSGRPSYTFSPGDKAASKPLVWSFGSGKISQVYLSPDGDTFNESHFSYFDEIHGFARTPAQPSIRTQVKDSADPAASAQQAGGRKVQMQEARRCFGCHAARVPSDGAITDFLPGVTCEVCHGPGANHTAAEQASLPQAAALILNPSRLRPVEQVDFCGACHATSMDLQMFGTLGLHSVRFPPYRLQNSRCWRDDARITCTACHNPHQPLQREESAYDQKCLACHVIQGATKTAEKLGNACPVSTRECATCHMPKYEFPEMHHKFTDHDIRVVRVGTPFPE